jgi:hypothetical protein
MCLLFPPDLPLLHILVGPRRWRQRRCVGQRRRWQVAGEQGPHSDSLRIRATKGKGSRSVIVYCFHLVPWSLLTSIIMIRLLTQVTPDQASHLDAMIYGLIVLLNMMPGKAYVGVHLNSGGCIHALKRLIERDYAKFCDDFKESGLEQTMKGRSYEEKLDMAWGVYARRELTKEGFDKEWERVYLELDEFEMFLGSMSVFHFGSRYPCFSRDEPIPLDWWHLRLHMYVGNKLLPADKILDTGKDTAKKVLNHVVVEEPVADNTIDLVNPPAPWRGLSAALPFYTSRGIA